MCVSVVCVCVCDVHECVCVCMGGTWIYIVQLTVYAMTSFMMEPTSTIPLLTMSPHKPEVEQWNKMLGLQSSVELLDEEGVDSLTEIDRVKERASTEEDGDHRDEDDQSIHNSRPSVTENTRVWRGGGGGGGGDYQCICIPFYIKQKQIQQGEHVNMYTCTVHTVVWSIPLTPCTCDGHMTSLL